MSIKMPSEEEKNCSINLILDRGIPSKKYLQIEISRLISEIGLRNLFWGIWDCVFLALLGGITMGVLFIIPSAMQEQLLPVGLLLISPAVYALLHFLTMWKEQQIGLYEIKMTCHYSLKELTALRMAFFGGASAFLDVLFVLCLRQQAEIFFSFFQMLGISLSALFLYGTATLFMLSHAKSSHQWSVPVSWCTVCIVPMIFHADIRGILMKIPGIVALAVAFLTAFLFFLQLEHYLSNRKGGVYHAVS